MNRTYAELLQVAEKAARAAGIVMREGWGKTHDIEFKGAVNLVTEVDRASEAAVMDILRAATPDFDILAEESGTHGTVARYRWVIDPIDGTTNYAHHFPYFNVSIGLEENGESIVGVVYDPIMDQLFTATRGGGAFLNGAAIAPSGAQTLSESVVATGLVYDVWESDRGIAEIIRLVKRARSLRINGSAALDICNVACGRLDGYCDIGLSPWDISAARLIVKEAGGIFELFGDGQAVGMQFGIASNGKIQGELVGLLLGRDGR
ncbi:MAG: inositol monophosphatase [Anaerolineae bacterium]|nr:inositol monophosphatase [Anaerolineae bacterium]